jgi:hypothetical protein
MKKFLTFLGGVVGVILVIAIIAAAILIPKAIRLDRDARAYMSDALPKIIDHWDSQQLVNRATPELMIAAKSPAEIERLFVMFRHLGAPKHLDEPKGGMTGQAFTGSGTGVFGNYTVAGSFEQGDATIDIQLKRTGDSWQINGFHIDSDAFIPHGP